MIPQFYPPKAGPSARKLTGSIVALALVAQIASAPVRAVESSALLDALVRKGILTSNEAAALQEEAVTDATERSANKLKLSNSLTELKLYGDVRLRYQYDSRDNQVDPIGEGSDRDRSPSGAPQSRWRFRLRLNADFKLGPDFFGGVELSTLRASDSGNQTFEDGFADYPIFISKAFLGWNAADWLTVTAGKVLNPFYTTELVWDADINPTGLTQSVALHKLFSREHLTGLTKEGKAADERATAESPWELHLNAGQFIFEDNAEGAGPDNDLSTDAYLFQTQLVGSFTSRSGTKIVIAPGWLTYVNGSLAGLDNANKFEDSANVSGATRNLNLLLLPGEIGFKLGGLKTKVLWDLSYNIEGRKRVEDIYNLVTLRQDGGSRDDGTNRTTFKSEYSSTDNFAFLIGLQIGENRKQGDWSFLANYRQIGIGAVDPNLNDSDWGQSELNMRGFKVSTAYNFTDFLVGALTYQYAWNLRDNLIGGEATGGNAIADANEVQTVQVDLSVKF